MIRSGPGRGLRSSAALFALGAAVVHFSMAPERPVHYLFGAVATVMALGVPITAGRRLPGAAALGMVAAIVWWLLAGGAGVDDIMSLIMEVVAAVMFLWLAAGLARSSVRRPARTAVGNVAALLTVAGLTTAGVWSGGAGMSMAVNVSPPVPGQPSTSVTELTAPPGPEPVKAFTLTARVSQVGGVAAWTYNGTVPGPELRVSQGDRIRVTLINQLPAATSVHWHGVRVPNAEDGVAGVSQDAVAPGRSYTYEFVATEAGTYWYHSHQDTQTQIGRGLIGALVVEPGHGQVAEGRDYTVVLHTLPTRDPVLINQAAAEERLAALPGQTVRLRVINAVPPNLFGGPQALVLLGAGYRVVALDGRDLNGPGTLDPQLIPLGMGQRADLVFTMPASGAVRLVDTELNRGYVNSHGRAGLSAATGSVTVGDGPAPSTGELKALPVFDPTRYGTPAADPVTANRPDGTYPIVLDEKPGVRDNRFELVHLINGKASPDVPPIMVHKGQTIRLHLVNNTGEYHPMHLHGHVLSTIAVDGKPVQGSPLHLDTALVGPHQTWDVAFLADNPGIWMFHCHVLLHASMGMSMMIEYHGITTPFEMGGPSGNVPE